MTPAAVYALALAELNDEARAVIATAVCWAEIAYGDPDPDLDPAIVGDENLQDDVWGPSIGLWQVRSLRVHTGTGKERDANRLTNPAFNARAMAVISKKGTDWTPWSVYKNGRYRQYLEPVQTAIEEKTVATVRGGKVLAHVQAFANACSSATGAESFGTYPGHSPSIDRALDIFVPISSDRLGNAICDYAIANQKRYGVRYVIYRQHIWHRLDPRWLKMEDRGNPTQNHFDHVHISFELTAAMQPEPEPTPEPEPEDDMAALFIVNRVVDGVHQGVYHTDGFYYWGLASEHQLAFFHSGKVHHLGDKDDAFFAGLHPRFAAPVPSHASLTDQTPSVDMVDTYADSLEEAMGCGEGSPAALADSAAE